MGVEIQNPLLILGFSEKWEVGFAWLGEKNVKSYGFAKRGFFFPFLCWTPKLEIRMQKKGFNFERKRELQSMGMGRK